MEVPITQFRRDIFALMNRAKQGESVSVTYKGERFLIIPELSPTTRFDRLTKLDIINPAFDDINDHPFQAEMEKAWEEDWAEI